MTNGAGGSLRGWIAALAVGLAAASAQCEREPREECAKACGASGWYDASDDDDDARACYEACIAACGCGFLPSPLGEDGAHFMDVCMQSEPAVRDQVTDCMWPCKTERRESADCDLEALHSDEAWGCHDGLGASQEDAVCRSIESCLLEEFDPSVIGRARVFIAFYDSTYAGSSATDADGNACADAAFAAARAPAATCEIYAGSASSQNQSCLLYAAGRANPCEKLQGTVRIHAERGQWVIPLLDLDCGSQDELSSTLIVRDVPMGDFEYVARARGINAYGRSVCLTARRELVGEAGADVHVQFDMPFARGGWQCEDDLGYCTDGEDNDEDGDADCKDLDCASFCGEFSEELCRNGLDDDDDGSIDCDDHECEVLCESSAASCEDQQDNDGDGDIDCDDEDCGCGPRRNPVRMGR